MQESNNKNLNNCSPGQYVYLTSNFRSNRTRGLVFQSNEWENPRLLVSISSQANEKSNPISNHLKRLV